jgi:hypothetical protein
LDKGLADRSSYGCSVARDDAVDAGCEVEMDPSVIFAHEIGVTSISSMNGPFRSPSRLRTATQKLVNFAYCQASPFLTKWSF